MLVLGDAEEVCAQRHFPVQLEAVADGLGEPLGEFVLVADGLGRHLDVGLVRLQDQLVRPPVLFGEDGAQRLVAGHQVVDGPLQRVGVEFVR